MTVTVQHIGASEAHTNRTNRHTTKQEANRDHRGASLRGLDEGTESTFGSNHRSRRMGGRRLLWRSSTLEHTYAKYKSMTHIQGEPAFIYQKQEDNESVENPHWEVSVKEENAFLGMISGSERRYVHFYCGGPTHLEQ